MGDIATVMIPGERTRLARRVRLESLRLTDAAVIVELIEGCNWEVLGATLALDGRAVRETYAPMIQRFELIETASADNEFLLGTWADDDPSGTAKFLDSWWSRHAEPWELEVRGPASRVLGDEPAD